MYENTPIFDEIPKTYSEVKTPWELISQLVLSRFTKDNEKLIKYINQALDYRDQLESKDTLVQLCVSRRKKNVLTERLPRFPMTVQKVENQIIRQLEKKYQQSRKAMEEIHERNKEQKRKILETKKQMIFRDILDEMRGYLKAKFIRKSNCMVDTKQLDRKLMEDLKTSTILPQLDEEINNYGLQRTRTRIWRSIRNQSESSDDSEDEIKSKVDTSDLGSSMSSHEFSSDSNSPIKRCYTKMNTKLIQEGSQSSSSQNSSQILDQIKEEDSISDSSSQLNLLLPPSKGSRKKSLQG